MLKNTEKNEFVLSAALLSGALGAIGGLASVLLLSLVFCGVALGLGDPKGAADIFAYAVLALGALIGGAIAMRMASA